MGHPLHSLGLLGFNPRYHLDLLSYLDYHWRNGSSLLWFRSVVLFIGRSIFFPKDPPAFFAGALPKFLVWFPLGVAALNYGRWYTFSTFFLLGAAMAYLVYVLRVPWMARFQGVCGHSNSLFYGQWCSDWFFY